MESEELQALKEWSQQMKSKLASLDEDRQKYYAELQQQYSSFKQIIADADQALPASARTKMTQKIWETDAFMSLITVEKSGVLADYQQLDHAEQAYRKYIEDV